MSRTNPRPARRRAGFTLVEVMVAATISVFVLAGILSTFVMLGRSAYNADSYCVMEAQSRRALELFSEDVRMAGNLVWANSQSVTLTVSGLSGATTSVTYAYDGAARTFNRTVGTQTQILVRNVTDFDYRRYKVVNGADYTAANDLETKQLQITFRCVQSGSTAVDATNAVLSARIVLRNKQVST